MRAILQISHFINGNEAIQEEVVIGHVSEYPTKVRRRVPSGYNNNKKGDDYNDADEITMYNVHIVQFVSLPTKKGKGSRKKRTFYGQADRKRKMVFCKPTCD